MHILYDNQKDVVRIVVTGTCANGPPDTADERKEFHRANFRPTSPLQIYL